MWRQCFATCPPNSAACAARSLRAGNVDVAILGATYPAPISSMMTWNACSRASASTCFMSRCGDMLNTWCSTYMAPLKIALPDDLLDMIPAEVVSNSWAT